MDYYGLLFLYYLKGLSGKSVLKLFFNIEAGGTEQLLPENTSAPTTTPILADIQYPDGLRTDQYFTYRETPTTVSNKARIKTIKGNTLVWNQLAELNSGATNNCTKSFDSTTGITTITPTNYSSNFVGLYNLVSPNYLITGHKYLISLEIKPTSNLSVLFGFDNNLVTKSLNANTFQTLSILQTQSSSNVLIYGQLASSGWASGTFQIKNVQCFDLTKMGLDITDPSEFTSLFPLSYYAFNQGTLLSFNGNGIKTVGKNLLNNTATSGSVSGLTYTVNEDKSVTVNGTHADSFTVVLGISMDVHSGEQLILAGAGDGSLSGYFLRYAIRDKNGTALPIIGNMVLVDLPTDEQAITVPNGAAKLWCYIAVNGNITLNNKTFYPMVRFADVQDSSYEPYASSTTNLPVSTYFPTGMKSAGTVYDELTPTKAITRVGAVDLGSLTWGSYSGNAFFYAYINDGRSDYGVRVMPNILCAVYQTVNTRYSNEFSEVDKVVTWSRDSSQVQIKDTSYSTVEAFKTAMSGVYLYYEMATPTETPITTEDANEALSLLMGKSVSSDNANQLINIITKGE